MNKAGDQSIRQLNQQSVVADVDDSGSKNLRITFINLPLKKLELLYLSRVDLRFGWVPFSRSNVFGNGSYFRHIEIAVQRIGPTKCAMHHQVGITPDRTREMQIVRFCQAIMTERLGSISCTFETFQQSHLERLLFGFSVY